MRFARPTAAFVLAAALACLSVGAAVAQDTRSLPGAVQVSNAKTIAENVAAAPALSDFAAGITGADLTATLSGAGPFTVFIPTRGAFDRLSRGTLPGWMRPDGKAKLTAVMTYHVVNGALTSDALAAQAKAANGEAPLATSQGGYITVKGGAKNLTLTDVNGTHARVIGEAPASNGVIFLIDNVLQP